ncbi:MAG: helix-turn-helix domain-containing protein, partial [Chloroflexi bacterium]|nr:helix-turn-helix domain-containing protein [Chloroflexota bacterium]
MTELRAEFVGLASRRGANRRELCQRFGISAPTGYKWLKRFAVEGPAGLQDRSRRPHHSPSRTPPAVEQAVLRLRAQHPTWGARKLRVLLAREGVAPLPAAS